MANAFLQPLTLSQLLGLEATFQLLQTNGTLFFQQLGLSPATAAATVDAVAKQEFTFLANFLANLGVPLAQAVSDLQMLLLFQSQALSQSTSQGSGSSQ
jgi:hypothetical protein